MDDRIDFKNCPKKNNYGTKAIKRENICHVKWEYGGGGSSRVRYDDL